MFHGAAGGNRSREQWVTLPRSAQCLLDGSRAGPAYSCLKVSGQQGCGSINQSSPKNLPWVAHDYSCIQQRHSWYEIFICASVFPTQCGFLEAKPELSCREAAVGLQVRAWGPQRTHERNHNHMQRQEACVWRSATSQPWIYVYMYMCMDCVSSVCSTPFGRNSSTVVKFKYITSKCSVPFLCICLGCFTPFEVALFCLTKVKIACKWSEKFIILWRFPVFWSDSFRELVWMIPFILEILIFGVSSQFVFMWAVTVGNRLLCHIAGYELVMCLGSPTDVPYWEKKSAGFSNCFCYAWYPGELESRPWYWV